MFPLFSFRRSLWLLLFVLQIYRMVLFFHLLSPRLLCNSQSFNIQGAVNMRVCLLEFTSMFLFNRLYVMSFLSGYEHIWIKKKTKRLSINKHCIGDFEYHLNVCIDFDHLFHYKLLIFNQLIWKFYHSWLYVLSIGICQLYTMTTLFQWITRKMYSPKYFCTLFNTIISIQMVITIME